ncbi:hypothetical protein [Pseudarthrobacter albicanus]|uniref:hypothetical protein n=1 Tax=Pseudarthrobacter albicanus TaxID=2823873 RepID=UPI001BABA4F9|nr:hypothetical protein [Pseudarthrobacter albicanus]
MKILSCHDFEAMIFAEVVCRTLNGVIGDFVCVFEPIAGRPEAKEDIEIVRGELALVQRVALRRTGLDGDVQRTKPGKAIK